MTRAKITLPVVCCAWLAHAAVAQAQTLAPPAPPAPATAQAPETPAATDKVHPFSYGDARVSLLFRDDQIQAMRSILQDYEGTHAQQSQNSEVKVDAPLLVAATPGVQKIMEPDNYPVFYLSSIVFRGPDDWALWLSGHKITAHRNATDVKVTAVSATSASFTWSPAYVSALRVREQSHSFADITAVKNKRVSGGGGATLQNGTVAFSLRPNQTFVPAYFAVFEGFISSPKLSVLRDVDLLADGDQNLPPARPLAPPPPNAPPSTPASMQAAIAAARAQAVANAVPAPAPAAAGVTPPPPAPAASPTPAPAVAPTPETVATPPAPPPPPPAAPNPALPPLQPSH